MSLSTDNNLSKFNLFNLLKEINSGVLDIINNDLNDQNTKLVKSNLAKLNTRIFNSLLSLLDHPSSCDCCTELSLSNAEKSIFDKLNVDQMMSDFATTNKNKQIHAIYEMFLCLVNETELNDFILEDDETTVALIEKILDNNDFDNQSTKSTKSNKLNKCTYYKPLFEPSETDEENDPDRKYLLSEFISGFLCANCYRFDNEHKACGHYISENPDEYVSKCTKCGLGSSSHKVCSSFVGSDANKNLCHDCGLKQISHVIKLKSEKKVRCDNYSESYNNHCVCGFNKTDHLVQKKIFALSESARNFITTYMIALSAECMDDNMDTLTKNTFINCLNDVKKAYYVC
jgi:hypothetical protein